MRFFGLSTVLQKIFVTGAAGFIASNLVDFLLAQGKTVVGWDNFSTGQPEFIAGAQTHEAFQLIRGDNLDLSSLTSAMQGCDTVFHLAANADVRFGLNHPRKDLEQNTIATFNVLDQLLVKIKHVAVRVAFAQDRDETKNISLKTEALTIGLDQPFAGRFGSAI